jgi:hypothetical protein
MFFLLGFVYSSQSGFEISPLNPLFSREELGEFIKEKNLKTTFTLVFIKQSFQIYN